MPASLLPSLRAMTGAEDSDLQLVPRSVPEDSGWEHSYRTSNDWSLDCKVNPESDGWTVQLSVTVKEQLQDGGHTHFHLEEYKTNFSWRQQRESVYDAPTYEQVASLFNNLSTCSPSFMRNLVRFVSEIQEIQDPVWAASQPREVQLHEIRDALDTASSLARPYLGMKKYLTTAALKRQILKEISKVFPAMREKTYEFMEEIKAEFERQTGPQTSRQIQEGASGHALDGSTIQTESRRQAGQRSTEPSRQEGPSSLATRPSAATGLSAQRVMQIRKPRSGLSGVRKNVPEPLLGIYINGSQEQTIDSNSWTDPSGGTTRRVESAIKHRGLS